MTLTSLLNRRDLWLGRSTGPAGDGVLDTGFSELNRALHHGGWPEAGLCELQCRAPCPLTLRLLLPGLAGLQQGGILLAAPPARPSARALQAAGLDLQRVLVLRGRQPDTVLRACREAAASEAFAALVLWWPDSIQARDLRRLQLAARQGHCWLTLIRPDTGNPQPSPAVLRLRLIPCPPGDLQLDILKQPGGWAGQSLRLPMLPDYLRSPLPDTVDMPVPDTCQTGPSLPPASNTVRPQALAPVNRPDINARLNQRGDLLVSPPLRWSPPRQAGDIAGATARPLPPSGPVAGKVARRKTGRPARAQHPLPFE